jgi:hypothetical protein
MRLGAALAAAAELEGRGELAGIRDRLQERREAGRGGGPNHSAMDFNNASLESE